MIRYTHAKNLSLSITDQCFVAMSNYMPGEIVAPTTLFRCSRYETMSERPEYQLARMELPWADLVKGPFEEHTIDCTHAEAMESPILLQAAEALMRRRPADPERSTSSASPPSHSVSA